MSRSMKACTFYHFRALYPDLGMIEIITIQCYIDKYILNMITLIFFMNPILFLSVPFDAS